jgi:Glycosyl transferase family 11
MIVTNLLGGLSNQIFQYACGRACALDMGTGLAISTDMFRNYTLRSGSELTRVFAIDVPEAGSSEMRRILGWQSAAMVRRLIGRPRTRRLAVRSFIAEPHFHYWPGLRSRLTASAYLQGYWQSERYFAHHADTLRNDLRFRDPPLGLNAELAARIEGSESVSLHVRRGDYASNPKTQALHGCLPLRYYEDALRHVLERIPNATIFAFSDDPQWVAASLLPRHHGLVIVDHNRGADSYNDMRLMSLCRHHIIANSSFSWWGAWLVGRRDKIVVAPDRWFANGPETTGLLPPSWVRL